MRPPSGYLERLENVSPSYITSLRTANAQYHFGPLSPSHNSLPLGEEVFAVSQTGYVKLTLRKSISAKGRRKTKKEKLTRQKKKLKKKKKVFLSYLGGNGWDR